MRLKKHPASASDVSEILRGLQDVNGADFCYLSFGFQIPDKSSEIYSSYRYKKLWKKVTKSLFCYWMEQFSCQTIEMIHFPLKILQKLFSFLVEFGENTETMTELKY